MQRRLIERLAEGVVEHERVVQARATFTQHSMMRLRQRSPQQQGPYGWLIGDVARNLTRAGKRDYTRRAPEVVEDIIEVLDGRDGVLMNRYLAATRPCVVKFYTTRDSRSCGCTLDDQIASVLVYLHRTAKEEKPYLNTCSAWTSMCGGHVEGHRVEHVELV